MNFKDTKKSVELVLATGEVPLMVGDSGIGKTALARAIAKEKDWSLVVIDGNLLKEGEIGGLPTVDENRTTVYAVHHKLRKIDEELAKGKQVLLFIDEINRCEHTVQQELMNLILNKEINGYELSEEVKILAAMNPSAKYGEDFDYQVVDMDSAQENRFVWLSMEADHIAWLQWAMESGIHEKVMEFISTYPEYLYYQSEGSIRATPRSYERVSKAYRYYLEEKEEISKNVFLHVVEGNVGKLIAQEFLHFIERDEVALVSYEEVFQGEEIQEELIEKIKKESHTRLYLAARNILHQLEKNILRDVEEAKGFILRLTEFLGLYPVDLRVGIMKDIKNSYQHLYEQAIDEDVFVDLYFSTHETIWG